MVQTRLPPKVTRVVPGALERHEAEDNLLSLVLTNAEEMVDMCLEGGITPASFGSGNRQAVFEIMLDLHKRGAPPHATVVREELERTGRWKDIGGDAFFDGLLDRDVTFGAAEYFIKTVHDITVLRSLHRATADVANQCKNGHEDVRAFIDQAEATIMAATSERTGDEANPLAAHLVESVGRVTEAINSGGVPRGLLTGFKSLDEMTYGFEPGDLVIIAGRPSMGKTTLAINIAENIALGKNRAGGKPGPVLVFSLEMKGHVLGLKMLASQMHEPLCRFKEGMVDKKKVDAAAKRLGEAPLYIDDRAGITVMEIRARARRMHKRYNLKAIVIDYLQLIAPTDARTPREQQISEISRQLKGLAKELGIPVIVLCQLNRAPDKDGRRPRLSDLRESGSLEQDADIVVLLSRHPSCMSETSVATEFIVADIAKQRMGITGDFVLRFVLAESRFETPSASDFAMLGASRPSGIQSAPRRPVDGEREL